MAKVSSIVVGTFDRAGSRSVRFIHEASKTGNDLRVALFDDELAEKLNGTAPQLPLNERKYFIENIRYVSDVYTVTCLDQLQDIQELTNCDIEIWSFLQSAMDERLQEYADQQGIERNLIYDDQLTDFSAHDYDFSSSSGQKVVVTGCFDWFHTGHICFFEEASKYGDLYVILGHDSNIRKLKGPEHPMFPEEERRYIAGSIRFVKEALISSGVGWLDAQPEIERLRPDSYVVNEDGDKDIKRRYCQDNGIEYVVLEREPKPGLQRRRSTDLRGF